jgi:hypothetical protein
MKMDVSLSAGWKDGFIYGRINSHVCGSMHRAHWNVPNVCQIKNLRDEVGGIKAII